MVSHPSRIPDSQIEEPVFQEAYAIFRREPNKARKPAELSLFTRLYMITLGQESGRTQRSKSFFLNA